MAYEKYTINKADLNRLELIHGGLLAISVVVLMELLAKSSLDTPLTISLYCLAISIPLITLQILTLRADLQYEFTINHWFTIHTGIAALLISFVGLGAMFWHFFWIVGVIFVVFGLYGLWAWGDYNRAIKEANQGEEPEAASVAAAVAPPAEEVKGS